MSGAAVGAKTARACDYCVRRRARWYCAADDAFLCQACDTSVHSANALARRHERVRLNTASLKCSPTSDDKPCIPSWPHRRPRTPRHGKYPANTQVTTANVPEVGRSSTTTTTTSREDEYDETDQLQLLYRVPVLDPLLAELCSSSAGESKYTEMMLQDDSPEEGFLPSLNLNLDLDLDMEDFAADMESFLGEGIEGESYDDFGLLVKAEEEEETLPFELNFDCNSPAASSEDVKQKVGKDEKREWRMSLRLDYDAIRTVWATQGSPWMNGERPQISPNDCWFHSTITMGSSTTVRAIGGQSGNGDGGREARVSRYREKRRTRLFSKKIRYEVRKLNAEKRPRMKGRFVKRSSFNPTPTPFPSLTK